MIPVDDGSIGNTLFVYGTLHPERAPTMVADVVRRFIAVGRGSVRGWKYDLGEYPGLVLDATGNAVAGDVFALPEDAEVLRRLDAYEGYDAGDLTASLFRRVRTLVAMVDGSALECWVYVYHQPLTAGMRPCTEGIG
jgi:gamma-glutamylcyclotransferase (GGCT)/AIG2-like uncharacterized protein YtfP